MSKQRDVRPVGVSAERLEIWTQGFSDGRAQEPRRGGFPRTQLGLEDRLAYSRGYEAGKATRAGGI